MIKRMLREAREEDLNFIYNSWLKSYRNSQFAKNMSNDMYYSWHKDVINKYLKQSQAIVSCNQDNPNQLFGYCVVEGTEIPRLHYVYVKYPYRKLGLAKELVGALVPYLGDRITMCSHTCYQWQEAKDKFKLEYNPYLMR